MPKKTLALSSIADWVEKNPPVAYKETTIGFLEEAEHTYNWDAAQNVYILDEHDRVIGLVPFTTLISEESEDLIGKYIEKVPLTVREHDSPQSVVYKSVRENISEVAVVTADGKLAGIVTANDLLSIMHDRHLEESLLMSGIRKKHGAKPYMLENAWEVLKYRLPWLIAGLAISMMLGFIVSRFESALDASIALAFFMPVITYMAASVGVQSEAVTIHTLAVSKFNKTAHVTKEVLVGSGIGVVVGILGGIGAFVISSSLEIGLVVAGSLVAAVTVASLIGSTIPMLLKRLNKDPSVASGPVAAAMQDAVSLIVYFGLATALVL